MRGLPTSGDERDRRSRSADSPEETQRRNISGETPFAGRSFFARRVPSVSLSLSLSPRVFLLFIFSHACHGNNITLRVYVAREIDI